MPARIWALEGAPAPTVETGKTLYGRLPGHPLSELGLQMAAEVAGRLGPAESVDRPADVGVAVTF